MKPEDLLADLIRLHFDIIRPPVVDIWMRLMRQYRYSGELDHLLVSVLEKVYLRCKDFESLFRAVLKACNLKGKGFTNINTATQFILAQFEVYESELLHPNLSRKCLHPGKCPICHKDDGRPQVGFISCGHRQGHVECAGRTMTAPPVRRPRRTSPFISCRFVCVACNRTAYKLADGEHAPEPAMESCDDVD